MNTSSIDKPDSEVISKIEKLLNLAAKGGTEGEAKAAFAMASKLMTKYGIEQHQLGKSEDRDANKKMAQVGIDKTWRSERPAHLYVRCVIKHCFHVSIVKVQSAEGIRYFCLGEKGDCAFAVYAFEVLADTFLRLQNEYLTKYNQPRKPKIYNGYFNGLMSGFNAAWDEAQQAQMAAQGAQSYALVLVDKDKALENYCRQCGIQSSKSNRTGDGHAYNKGVEAGRNISLARPLGAGNSTPNAQIR